MLVERPSELFYLEHRYTDDIEWYATCYATCYATLWLTIARLAAEVPVQYILAGSIHSAVKVIAQYMMMLDEG